MTQIIRNIGDRTVYIGRDEKNSIQIEPGDEFVFRQMEHGDINIYLPIKERFHHVLKYLALANEKVHNCGVSITGMWRYRRNSEK